MNATRAIFTNGEPQMTINEPKPNEELNLLRSNDILWRLAIEIIKKNVMIIKQVVVIKNITHIMCNMRNSPKVLRDS